MPCTSPSSPTQLSSRQPRLMVQGQDIPAWHGGSEHTLGSTAGPHAPHCQAVLASLNDQAGHLLVTVDRERPGCGTSCRPSTPCLRNHQCHSLTAHRLATSVQRPPCWSHAVSSPPQLRHCNRPRSTAARDESQRYVARAVRWRERRESGRLHDRASAHQIGPFSNLTSYGERVRCFRSGG